MWRSSRASWTGLSLTCCLHVEADHCCTLQTEARPARPYVAHDVSQAGWPRGVPCVGVWSPPRPSGKSEAVPQEDQHLQKVAWNCPQG